MPDDILQPEDPQDEDYADYLVPTDINGDYLLFPDHPGSIDCLDMTHYWVLLGKPSIGDS